MNYGLYLLSLSCSFVSFIHFFVGIHRASLFFPHLLYIFCFFSPSFHQFSRSLPRLPLPLLVDIKRLEMFVSSLKKYIKASLSLSLARNSMESNDEFWGDGVGTLGS